MMCNVERAAPHSYAIPDKSKRKWVNAEEKVWTPDNGKAKCESKNSAIMKK